MASAHSTSWAEADVTSPSRDRALAVSRMVLGSVIRGAVGIRATLPSGPGAWNRYNVQPIMAPRYSEPVQKYSDFATLCYDGRSKRFTRELIFAPRHEQ